jgi:site-specific DNA-cytosine methylase
LKDVRIDTDAIMNDMPSNGDYNAKTNTITIHADELKYMNSILNHEIQHAIQHIEGFARGGSPRLIRGEVKKKFNEVTKQIRQLRAEGKEDEAKALVEKNRGLYNAYQKNDDYNSYKSLAGEVEARNVQSRMGMTDEERKKSLAEETEDVNRDEQIVMNGSDASYSIVKDPDTIKKLDKEDTVKVYRAMQVGEDGKLYPPMAAKVKGKFVEPIELGKWEQADERPELADDKGMFTLNKGNGKSLKAAYNPYLHTSRTPLNDQFSEAQNRPNIVTVEVEVPKSELTSGYKADKAKDAVGEVEWKAGIIQGQLTGKRKVVLSRWDKPVRIVPDSEVADVIVNDMFKGKNITMPSNVVTPSLRKELEKRGVPFVETDNRGRIVGGENDGVHYSKVYGKNAQSPILEQKLQKHPDSLMKAGTYFSGGGLVEEGLKGIIDPVVAVEYDRKISGVYRNNFGQHIVTADVRDVDPKELVKHIDGEVEYFHASPVCKNYSQAKSNGGEVELDKETAKSTADFIDAVKPRVVTIENVKGYKDSEAMKIITKALDKNGYKWDADVYNAADFGGYTSRERLIVRAVKDGELPEKPKKQPRKGGWLEAVEDILPTLTEKKNGVAPWMDTRLKADGIDWKKVEKPLYVMGSAYADGKIPHAYGDEILPTLRTKSGDVIIMPGGKVLRADGRVLARITGLGDDYLLPKTESLAHTIIGNGIPVQLTKGVIAPLLNKDDLSGRNVLARLGSSIFKNNWDADKQKQVSDRVVNTANKLGGAEATVYTSVDEVPDAYLSDVKNGATGWYDPTTHTVHVYLPNCADAYEAQRTVFHEKIGHEGMEVLLGGEQGVRKFADFVYKSVDKKTRGKILDFAHQYDPGWNNPDRINIGTQEYIAHLAEEGPTTAEDFSLWTKIKHYLIKVLKKLGIRVPGLLNDKDLRYYLMKAGKALHVWDNMPKEKQEAMMAQASNAEIKDALADGAGKGKPRQKKGESAIQYMKRVMEWKRWKEAREDTEDPEPPMFYDIDKDEAGKKEWELLNKEWRDRHHLAGEEPTGMPVRMKGETDDAYMTRIHDYEKWKDAMKDEEDPIPDMFDFEKSKQEEVKRKYEDWLARHELLEQQQADLDLYEGKIYPAETNPKADDLEQQVMQDLAEVTSTDVSKEGAAKTVKHAVIHRRKNMEEASADDAIYINDVKNRIEKMAGSGVFDKLLSDYKGKKTRAEKLAETIPYIIEAPRRLRDMAQNLNATGAFDKGHIHIQPADVEAIQPYVTDLIVETAKKHTEIKKGKEVEVYDNPQAVSEVASKMAQAINANHQGEEGFVPIDGTDILSKHVLKLVKQRVVPGRINYKELSPEMQAAIDSIRDWYNYTYDWLMDNRTLKAGTGYNVDYVNHIWDKEKSDPNAYATFVENRQRTKSPNEKKRTISTLMEGVYAGLVPKTTDITKMMAYYSRSNIEAWANKTMLQEVSGLNVIERNEDGEIISSDPLLSSVAPFNLEQYKYFEIPGVGPVWVYNVSPKQVTVKNPITDNEKVLYSEASAGDRFGVVFDTYQSSPFWKAFDTLASSAKKLELGFSGFHAGALTEVYMVQNMVEFGLKKAMANFMKYIFADTAKNHELPCFANPQDFQEAASHLVKFGATNDYAAADVQNMFDNLRDAMMKVQEKLKDGNGISGTVALATMPLKVATQMLSLINKGMDVALWDFLHDGLKLATYRMRADRTKERAKKYGWTDEQLGKALDEDGQFVNDMFGGQHWDIVGASQRTIRIAGRCLLSPDWNKSTTSHFLAITGFGSVWNEATFENFKNYYKNVWGATRGKGKLTPDDWGRLSRQLSALLCYGIGFMIFYEGFANAFNAAFRALDEEKERKKAEELRKTNPNYRSPYELAYPDGMKWYDYLMRGNSLGQQSKIFMGRYADGTEMYIRHGKQFREVPEYLFNHKGELEFPGPMVQRMIGKANPMVRMTLDDINYLSDFQASHADQEIQRKYGKTIGLLYKDALYWAPFLIPSQENKEFKAVDFFFPSSKGFSPWKAQSYFKDFILSGDMEGVVMTYQSCERNGIDAEAQIKAAIGSVKALESAEMQDGVTSLQVASERFDEAKSITEKKKMRQKMKKFLSMSAYKAFTQKEALDMVQSYLNGEDDLKEMEKAENKYLMKAKSEDVTEDWRIQAVWNGTMETYDEYQRLKDVDKAKANAFKNSKTNKRLFAARKAISAAKKKMNKAKKQMDGQNDAAKMVEIRKTRKELLKTLNGME